MWDLDDFDDELERLREDLAQLDDLLGRRADIAESRRGLRRADALVARLQRKLAELMIAEAEASSQAPEVTPQLAPEGLISTGQGWLFEAPVADPHLGITPAQLEQLLGGAQPRNHPRFDWPPPSDN